MNCQEIADKLALLLYDELEADEAEAVRSHLETCGSCGEQWRELQKTKTLLDEWQPAEAGADVQALLGDEPPVVATIGPRSRRWLFPSIVTGMAAGLLIMATLFFAGVDIQKTEGRLTISFGRAPASALALGSEPVEAVPANLRDFDPQAFEQRIQQATYEKIDQTSFELAEDISSFLQRWDEMQEQQRIELANLLARAFQDDLQRLEQNVAAVAEGAATDNLRTMRALDELALAVSRGEWTPLSLERPQ